MEAQRAWLDNSPRRFVMIAGVVGGTRQAVAEATVAQALNYDAALLSLGAMRHATDAELIAHCRAVADVMPVFGFYLQPAVGGRVLSYEFWCAFANIKNVCAVKIAPFNRYQTLDVVRAISAAGRTDIALYTGNDDSIVHDLLTPFPVSVGGEEHQRFIDGGLLGQWAVWTRSAVDLLERVKFARSEESIPATLLREGGELTAANAAIFDAAHLFAGCIPGIHEVLRRSGLLEGVWCLDPGETLSSGQMEAIDRACAAYPGLSDYEFIKNHVDRWLA
jgi:hypothetical protein